MAMLARWKSDIYRRDVVPGRPLPYHFNSSQRAFRNSLLVGDDLWLFGDRQGRQGQQEWVLMARFRVQERKVNAPGDPGFGYGEFGILADPKRSEYFDINGPDMTRILMRLRFESNTPIKDSRKIGNACQSVRLLTTTDVQLLKEWSAQLRRIAEA